MNWIALALCLCGSLLPAAEFSFPAQHEHRIGRCHGTLVISDSEVRYDAAAHAAKWPYGEIQQLKLTADNRVSVLTYHDRTLHFAVEGELGEAAVFLAGKLDQRFVNGFVQKPGPIIAQFEVQHLRPVHSDEGTLSFGEDSVAYRSTVKSESRAWRYADIEGISTSGPFDLTVTTYERQRVQYATRRVFNFKLKNSLPEDVYNRIWRRLNRPRELVNRGGP